MASTQSCTDPFSMVVSDGKGKRGRRIRVPGVVVSNAEFVQAYEFGRSLYYSVVCQRYDRKKGEWATSPLYHLERLLSVKVRDVTDEEVIAFIADVMQEYEPRRPDRLVERAGLLFGYIAACVEEAYGLVRRNEEIRQVSLFEDQRPQVRDEDEEADDDGEHGAQQHGAG